MEGSLWKNAKRKFELGRVVVTRGIHEAIREDASFGDFVDGALIKHSMGDWGDLDPEDAALNDEALKSGEDRIFSVYKRKGIRDGKIWVITEWDRSATTILFPSEY